MFIIAEWSTADKVTKVLTSNKEFILTYQTLCVLLL